MTSSMSSCLPRQQGANHSPACDLSQTDGSPAGAGGF